MIRGKREFLGAALLRSGMVSVTLAAKRRFPARTLTILNYHRVDDHDAAWDFDDGTLDATPEVFDDQIAWLCKEFTLLDPHDLLDHVRGRPWPRNPALITFDDGYRDNHDHALPILNRHGAKALFFVATDYVANRRVFWWDRISYILKHATKARVVIKYPRTRSFDLSGDPESSLRNLLEVPKWAVALDMDRFLSELAQAAEVPWNEALERGLAERLVMTWDHVRALRNAGMGIGSHTRRHRVLATIPDEELSDELYGSRSDLEAALGEPVRTIAYPVGVPVGRVPHLRAAVEAAGYELGFTYRTGVQSLRKIDPLDLHRQAVNGGWSDARFRAVSTFPWLATARPV